MAKKQEKPVERKFAHITMPTAAKERKEFPIDLNDTKNFPFKTAEPEGFSHAAHVSLKRKDFTNEKLFYLYRAADLDYKANVYRRKSEECVLGGGAKGKRLIKMQEKMVELRAMLEADGINVDELLG